jgi:arsenate reductase
VVTVCDSASEECPVWLAKGKRLHRGFTDPFNAQGTDEEQMNVYREVRDQIRGEIIPLLEKHAN